MRDNDGTFQYSNIIDVEIKIPVKFMLSQNYPNPFNPNTNIIFHLPKEGRVLLTIYNILGEQIKTLVDEVRSPGVYTSNFDASRISSGIYFCSIRVYSDKGDIIFTNSKKMSFIK